MSGFEKINTEKERKALNPHRSEERTKRRRIRTESLLKYLEEKLFVVKVNRRYRTPKGKIITKNAWKDHFGSQDPMGFFSGTVSHDLVLELSSDVAAAVITIKRARVASLSSSSRIVVSSFTTLGWISLEAPKNQKGEGSYELRISGVEGALIDELFDVLGIVRLTEKDLINTAGLAEEAITKHEIVKCGQYKLS